MFNIGMRFTEGDLVRYETFGDNTRLVEVTAVLDDVKNGEPGFDGIVVEGPETGMNVWGYSSQVLEVMRQSRTTLELRLPDGTVASWSLELGDTQVDQLTDWLEARLGKASVQA